MKLSPALENYLANVRDLVRESKDEIALLIVSRTTLEMLDAAPDITSEIVAGVACVFGGSSIWLFMIGSPVWACLVLAAAWIPICATMHRLHVVRAIKEFGTTSPPHALFVDRIVCCARHPASSAAPGVRDRVRQETTSMLHPTLQLGKTGSAGGPTTLSMASSGVRLTLIDPVVLDMTGRPTGSDALDEIRSRVAVL